MEAKTRKVVKIDLRTGNRTETLINNPVTLAHHIRAMALLNKSAHIYGFIYLPDDSDEDWREFIK